MGSNEVAVCLHDCPWGSFCLGNQCIFHRPADGGLDQEAQNAKPHGVQDYGIGIELSHHYMDMAKEDAKGIEQLSTEVPPCLTHCPPPGYCVGLECIFQSPTDGGHEHVAQSVKLRGVQDYGIGIEPPHHYMDIAKEDAKEIEKLSNEVVTCLHCPPGSFCLANQCVYHQSADGGLDQDAARTVKPLGVQGYGIGIEPPHHYMDIAKEDAKEIEAMSGHNGPIEDFAGQHLHIDMVRH